ncbi:unnamed protein product [Ectocarpus sp. 12 AP-2014]
MKALVTARRGEARALCRLQRATQDKEGGAAKPAVVIEAPPPAAAAQDFPRRSDW